MRKLLHCLTLLAALFAAACASNAPVATRPVDPQDRYLIDPRNGYQEAVAESIDRKFAAAWLGFEAGDDAGARRQLEQLQTRQPGYLPAGLALAALDIREGRLDLARTIVDATLKRAPRYTAARVYDAELAVREGNLRRAYTAYVDVTAHTPVPDVSRDRVVDVRRQLLSEMVTRAQGLPPAQSAMLLSEALTIDPSARPTRMLLVQSLIAQRKWDAARTVVEPLLAGDSDRSDVQEALAEIEIGRGQYEQAIARYERLARRDPKYIARLDVIKEQWSAANMPPQYVRALESEDLTRTDLSVLLYWKVASIRFAQNLSTPPIAVDISDVIGREEVIRAIAIGMLQVDPVTRRVNPGSTVNAPQLTRYAARVLTNRGASCARGAGNDPSRILAACQVTDLAATLPPEAAVTGRAASEVVGQIDHALRGQ